MSPEAHVDNGEEGGAEVATGSKEFEMELFHSPPNLGTSRLLMDLVLKHMLLPPMVLFLTFSLLQTTLSNNSPVFFHFIIFFLIYLPIFPTSPSIFVGAIRDPLEGPLHN